MMTCSRLHYESIGECPLVGRGPPSEVIPYNGATPSITPSAAAPRQKGRPRKRKPKDLEAMTANLGNKIHIIIIMIVCLQIGDK